MTFEQYDLHYCRPVAIWCDNAGPLRSSFATRVGAQACNVDQVIACPS